MNDLINIIDKAGLAVAVLLVLHFDIKPELRGLRRDIWNLTSEIAKGAGRPLPDRTDRKPNPKS